MVEYRIWRDVTEESFEGEVWKVYPNNNLYEISSLGRVRNAVERKLRSGHFFWKGRVIAQHQQNKNTHKYLRVKMSDIRSPVSVHRAVAETFIPNPENKPQVNHMDGDKTNNRVDNLEWVTARENKIHSVAAGLCTFPTGEYRNDVVYNADIAREILRLYFYELKTSREIGEITKILKDYVSLIIRGKRWIEVYADFIEADKAYCIQAREILTNRRQSNRSKIEEKVRDLKRMAQ